MLFLWGIDLVVTENNISSQKIHLFSFPPQSSAVLTYNALIASLPSSNSSYLFSSSWRTFWYISTLGGGAFQPHKPFKGETNGKGSAVSLGGAFCDI